MSERKLVVPESLWDGAKVWVLVDRSTKLAGFDLVARDTAIRLGVEDKPVETWRACKVLCAAGDNARVLVPMPDGPPQEIWRHLYQLRVEGPA